jgi:capsular polysaccharide biosynthesis protein
MTDNAQIPSNPPEDEIRLIDILGFLVFNKNLILSIVSFFTLSSVIYCFSATPIYKATISFMPSQEFHISEPMVNKRLSQIQQSIFKQFIDQMKSPDMQQKVATEGGFLEKFKDGPNDTTDTAQLISRINNSITTSLVLWKKDLNLMSPTTVEMTGKDPKVISEFLNALSETGIKTAQDKTSKLIQEAGFKVIQELEETNLKLTQDLNQNQKKIELKLAFKIAKEKFIQDQKKFIQDQKKFIQDQKKFIQDQKIPDDQFNITIIEQELEILRKQAKAVRLRKIKILEDHLSVAGNFTEMEKNIKALDPFSDFAFLNGKKTIQTLITILRKRTDDLYDPRIIKLQVLLEAAKNNQIKHRPSSIVSNLPLRNLKSESEIKQSEYLINLKNESGIKQSEYLRKLESRTRFQPKTKQSKDIERNLKKIRHLKENLKIRPEVVITSRKNFLPQEPSTPEKTKIITCAIIIGVFFGIFIAILRSGLRVLKRTKSLGSP